MNLTINGESQVFSAENLAALVEQLGMKADRVAIELNREIVSRRAMARRPACAMATVWRSSISSGADLGLASRFRTC